MVQRNNIHPPTFGYPFTFALSASSLSKTCQWITFFDQHPLICFLPWMVVVEVMLEGGDHISERAHTYTFTANTHMYVCIILKWGPPMNHQSYFLAFCACLLLCFLRPEYKHFLSDDSVSPIFCKSFNLGPPSPEAFLPFCLRSLCVWLQMFFIWNRRFFPWRNIGQIASGNASVIDAESSPRFYLPLSSPLVMMVLQCSFLFKKNFWNFLTHARFCKSQKGFAFCWRQTFTK